ncbi:WbqC family protein [Actinosynnema sp. NPDC023587]|uniref:WbqC family protein n=1 Tax=Actinosynnema sp. NPDC023587 TaxID=3154695 RepID=UPI0033D4A6F2
MTAGANPGPGRQVRVAAHQPGYHRHLYYYRKMAAADVFVSLDNVQFVARDWQNRQEFHHDGRRRWLSVPVNRGREQLRHKRIVDHAAVRRHWALIRSIYRGTPHFADYEERLHAIYHQDWEFLRDLCDALTSVVRDALGIATPYVHGATLVPEPRNAKGALLADLARGAAERVGAAGARITYLACAAPLQADHYLLRPGPEGARTEGDVLADQGVELGVFDYRHPVYPQHQLPPGHPFEAELSAFDLLFNAGPAARAVFSGAARAGARDSRR